MNVKLILKRTSFWIHPYNPRDSKGLEGSLSVWDNLEKRYTQKLYDFDPLTRTLKIPRGVGLEFIEMKLNADGIFITETIDHSNQFTEPRHVEFDIHSEYRIKDESEEDYSVRDKFQGGAVNFILTEKDQQKMVSLDTGFGKTFCSIIAAQKQQVPVMIICRTLGKQWIDFILGDHKGYTNLTKFEVIQIVGSNSIEKLLKVKKSKQEGVFYVASTDTLISYKKSGGDLQELADHLGIGTKVFDEAHLNYVANTIIDCNMDVQETIYLTATPGRSESRQNFLFKRIYRYVPIFGTETHTLKQYYNIRLVNYNTWPTADQVADCSTRRGFNSRSYAEYIFTSQPKKVFYYAMIRKLIKTVMNQDPDCRIMIILDRKSDIQQMHDILLKDLGIDSGRYCTLIEKADERELELQKPVIFSTLGSGVTGKDIKNLRVVMAMTSFSSNIIVRQLLGRLRYIEGKKVYYLDFMDAGFPQMIGQRKTRERELKIRANSWETIEYDFDELIDYLHAEFAAATSISHDIPKPKKPFYRKASTSKPGGSMVFSGKRKRKFNSAVRDY